MEFKKLNAPSLKELFVSELQNMILSGKLETTKGDIVITPRQRLSVLEQDHFKYDEQHVMDVVIMGNARLYEIMK